MESNSPLDTLPPTLSKPLEDVANEKQQTDSAGKNEPEESDQPDVAVSPPSDGEASSDDLGPEDCVRSPKKETKAPSTGADPSPKYMPLRAKRPQNQRRHLNLNSEYARTVANGPFRGRMNSAPRNPKDRVAQAIYHKFITEWEDPTGELAAPEVTAIYQISLPYYEDRFLDAMQVPNCHWNFAKAQAHGGSNTKSAWFACQCICDVGVKSADLCNFRSCGICMVVKSGFDELAFGQTTNNGIYGDGIYANLNPAMAHRFTVRKVDHDSRVVILCSIVELEPGAPVENILDYGAAIDGSGKVFCAKKDVIIPRRLVVYSIKPPAQQGPTTKMDVD
ncbi:hypothetical protein FRC04_012172 [Tulasnella sp. 424]|nr:hypothetical protein FRC04_012172 [Tulasnella sp. 424]